MHFCIFINTVRGWQPGLRFVSLFKHYIYFFIDILRIFVHYIHLIFFNMFKFFINI